MSLYHQHNFVGSKWRSKGDVRQGRNTRHNVLIAFETSGSLGQNPNMRIDTQNFVLQTGLEATHYGEDHDQDHDADGNPTYRDHGDQRDKRLTAPRLEIAQSHSKFVGHS